MDIYERRVWRKGCHYIVASQGSVCNKCGEIHNQTAAEAEIGLFTKDNSNEKTSD